MSVKGWNFKLLIAVGHGFEGGRRVRLPSSAPCEPFEVNNFKGFSSPFPQTRCLHPWYLPFCTSGFSSDFPFLWFPTSPLSFPLFPSLLYLSRCLIPPNRSHVAWIYNQGCPILQKRTCGTTEYGLGCPFPPNRTNMLLRWQILHCWFALPQSI